MINKKISFGAGSEYKYDWGYFDNNGSYQASTKGHSDNLAIYANLGWNVNNNLNISLFGRNDNHKQTRSNETYKINFDQKFKKINLGVSYMNKLETQHYMKCLVLIIMVIQEIETSNLKKAIPMRYTII